MCRAQPCFVFAGEQFENDARFRLAKSMILDMFRGRLIESINLKVRCSRSYYNPFMVHSLVLMLRRFCNHGCLRLQGLDHVIFVAAVDSRLLFKTYAIRLKKSGTQVGCCSRLCKACWHYEACLFVP